MLRVALSNRVLVSIGASTILGLALLTAVIVSVTSPEDASDAAVAAPTGVAPAVAGAASEPLEAAVAAADSAETSGEADVASDTATTELTTAGVDLTAAAADYRAAVGSRDDGDYVAAAALFDRVAGTGGPLAPFALFRSAQMTSLAGDPGSAADAYEGLLGFNGGPSVLDHLPPPVRPLLLAEAATAFAEADRASRALEALERIEQVSLSPFTLASARWRRAELLHAQGDAAWHDLAVEAMTTAPSSSAARAALDLLDEEGADYPALPAALVQYRGHRTEDAEERYLELLAGGELTTAQRGEAWFYLGAVEERLGRPADALESYASSLIAAPAGDFADDARYWRGRVLEELERPSDAAKEYDLLVAEHIGSGFGEDARLRAAVALGLAGNGAEATARLAEITRTASPTTAAKAAHWHTVLVDGFQAPRADIRPASDFDPTSYAAAFAAGGDRIVGPLPASATLERPRPIEEGDAAEVKAWIGASGAQQVASTTPILQDESVVLAWELLAGGESSVARTVLYDVISQRREQALELVDLAFEARRRGMPDLAMHAAATILKELEPVERLKAPRALLAIAYPLPFFDEATAAADEFDLPVLLLYSLVRQESAFNTEAGSSVGAYGLTQVMEATGELIAKDLDVDGWVHDDLTDPGMALRFGAYYLAVQLNNFDGHMLAALAAYNGGPGNARRWLDAQRVGGPDGYLYAVDYTETRLYLETVSANYAMYRYLYAGAHTPLLPH